MQATSLPLGYVARQLGTQASNGATHGEIICCDEGAWESRFEMGGSERLRMQALWPK